MSLYLRTALCLGLLAIPVGASRTGVLAQKKPDLSGTWVLNLEKSRLQIEAKIERGTFTIEHKEPQFLFSRVFIVSGKEDAVSYALTTDGKEKIDKEPGRTTTSRLYWDGDVLVFDERIVLTDGREATNVVRYSLRDGGRTLVAEEKFRGPFRKHDNLWVADRKT
jgi:hypothetical protein